MRLIDADHLKTALRPFSYEMPEALGNTTYEDVWFSEERIIDREPTIDPVKHGKWVYKGARGRFPICECSVCGNAENADWAILGDNVNYCPNCGAKMENADT